MQENKRKNLSANERKIVELTLQGESQVDIANKLDVAPSTVYRTLRREHIQDMISSATQGLMSSLVQKMLQNYEKAQERVNRHYADPESDLLHESFKTSITTYPC